MSEPVSRSGQALSSSDPSEIASLQSRLRDRYTIKREIGHGGMAVVYLADDVRHQREVAIKVIRPDLAAAVGVERFLREIHIEASLQHPHILPLHDSGDADGVPYYVMPYVAGETLRARLEREKQLPVQDALRIAREVADALSYAHSHGFVHRDVKPENILLSADHALVSDFGIAHAIAVAGAERLTGTGISVGTPAYMSPEQGGGSDAIDGRSDVYSLGCVLFEMLAGEPPFTGRTAQAIIARHMQERPPSLLVVRPGLSPGLVKVIERALAKVPADRFPTASRFGEALRAINDESEETPPRRAEARQWARGLASVAAMLAAAAIGWQVIRSAPARLDANRVVVFPLRDVGAAPGGQGAGEDIATYIGHVLDGSDPLRWDEGRDWLGPTERGDPGKLSVATAGAVTRSRHARFFIDGSILRGPDSVTVVLRLYDAEGDSLLKRAGHSGPPGASEARLGALGAADLLPVLLAPGRRVDVGPLADRAPAAIANFLQGERSYRESNFAAALGHYRAAVEADSDFALAAIKGAQAASWLDDSEEAERMTEVALRREQSLPSRFAQFGRGLRDYQHGAADSAVGHFQDALRISPDWGEAWMALGEVYYHLLPDASPLDSLAEAAFLQAQRIDPDFTPPLFHLTERALHRNDLTTAKRFIDRFRRAAPDSTLDLQLTLMLGCVERTLRETDWAEATRTGYPEVLEAAGALSASPFHAACAEAGFRAVLAGDSVSPSHRFGALFGLQSLLVSRRRYQDVRTLLRSEPGVQFAAEFLYILDAAVDTTFERDAEAWAQRQDENYLGLSTTRLWLLGMWQAHRGAVREARGIASALVAKADSSQIPQDRLFAEIIQAHVALAAGDSALALRAFQALAPAATRGELAWSLWGPLGLERLTMARLLFRRGEIKEALRTASVFDSPQPVSYLLYLPASLALRARAAEVMDDPVLAKRYRARLAAIGRSDLLVAPQ